MTRPIDYKVASPEQVAGEIGHTLARLRLARNQTQRDLAASAGISERTLKRFEAGEGATLDTLIRLMQALDLSQHLAALLPDPKVQPEARLGRGERERQRARPARDEEKGLPWSWDEEQTP